MRYSVVAAALLSAAIASPVTKRQDIEFDQYDSSVAPVVDTPEVGGTGETPTYDANAAAQSASASPVTSDSSSKLKARDGNCAAQPKGKGPVTSPDTDVDFLANTVYNQTAQAAPVPDGYSLSFGPNFGATSATLYMGYKTLDSFDPISCQQWCDSQQSCYFFNVFYERDPTLDAGDKCSNPASTTNIKCSIWGAHTDQTTATNDGQWRDQFHVVIAGSMGYNKLAPPSSSSGFSAPVPLGGAIQAPDNSYIGYKYFAGPYNPAQCASSCQATTAYNSRHPRSDGSYDTCAFFNSYVLSKNAAPQGTYCSMYTKTWGNQVATNYGQHRGNDYYSVSQSYGWSLSQS